MDDAALDLLLQERSDAERHLRWLDSQLLSELLCERRELLAHLHRSHPQQAPVQQFAPGPAGVSHPPASPYAQAFAPPVGAPVTGPAPTQPQSMPAGFQPVQPVQPVQPPQPPMWQRPGFAARAIAITGAGVTLIGVAFLLVLAAQYGLFGPLARAVSAALLGVALVALAFVVRRRDAANPGAPVLAATGVAAGFLSIVTATVIYGWLPPVLGVVLVVAVGVGGLALARSWANEWVGLVAVGGGLLLATWMGADAPVVTASLMVVFMVVTSFAEWGTNWRWLPFVRVLPIVAYLNWIVGAETSVWKPPTASPAALSALVVIVALVALGGAWFIPRRIPAQQIAAGLAIPAVLPVALLAFALPSDQQWWAVGLLGVVAVPYVTAGATPAAPAPVRAVAVPIGATFALLALYVAAGEQFFGVLTLAMALVYLAAALRLPSRIVRWVGAALASLGVLGWTPAVVLLFLLPDPSFVDVEKVVASLGVVGVSVLGALVARRYGATPSTVLHAGWAGALLGASVAVIGASSLLGRALGDEGAGYQIGQVVVTVTWMATCVFFLRRALADRARADAWLRLALVVAVLAVLKLFLIDLGTLGAAIRVVAFLGVGLLLLFVGTRYAKAWDRAKAQPAEHAQDGAPSYTPGAPS